jgi:signal transduction histidine kinase
MSNHEPQHDRLDDLFAQAEPPHPEPDAGVLIPEQPAAPAVEALPSEPAPELPASPATPLRRPGWQDYLNAIDRDEQIGLAFEQMEIEPPGGDGGESGDQAVAVPLQLGDEILGALQLEGVSSWSNEELQMVTSIAQQVSQHIENLRLLEQTEQYRREAEQATRRLTHAGWDEYLQMPAAPARGYLYDQKRVVAYDPVTDISGVVSDAGKLLSQPLTVRDESIGQLVVADAQRDVEEANRLLSVVANRLSIHIENLRLLDETERARQQLDKRAAELETVAQVSTAAATILDPQALLQSVVDLAQRSFGLYHASVYLLDDSGHALNVAAASGLVGEQMLAQGHTIYIEQKQSIIAKAARTRQVMIVADAQVEPEFLPYSLLPHARSEMAIPMIVADRLVGVFDVESETPQRFTAEESRTYTTLSAQTAVALRNAELYAEQMATVERLRELDHLKSSFLANMSHELRTPLNSILGFTQVILEGLDGPLTDDMQMDLGLIEKNGQHLLNLINEVLDMAKIEAGRVSLSLEPLNLAALLGDVLRTTSPLARERTLVLELDSHLPEGMLIMADAVRLRQVLINVIGNAIKFTDQGGVYVSIEQLGSRVQIRVRDTGIGIPPEKLETIFEAFSQVDTSTTRKVGGTGLGLPISRRLAEMHGGGLWADSKGIPGEGSVFTLELPIGDTSLA